MNTDARNTSHDLTDEVPEADAVDQNISVDEHDVDDDPSPLTQPTVEADAADVWEQTQVVPDEQEAHDHDEA